MASRFQDIYAQEELIDQGVVSSEKKDRIGKTLLRSQDSFSKSFDENIRSESSLSRSVGVGRKHQNSKEKPSQRRPKTAPKTQKVSSKQTQELSSTHTSYKEDAPTHTSYKEDGGVYVYKEDDSVYVGAGDEVSTKDETRYVRSSRVNSRIRSSTSPRSKDSKKSSVSIGIDRADEHIDIAKDVGSENSLHKTEQIAPLGSNVFVQTSPTRGKIKRSATHISRAGALISNVEKSPQSQDSHADLGAQTTGATKRLAYSEIRAIKEVHKRVSGKKEQSNTAIATTRKNREFLATRQNSLSNDSKQTRPSRLNNNRKKGLAKNAAGRSGLNIDPRPPSPKLGKKTGLKLIQDNINQKAARASITKGSAVAAKATLASVSEAGLVAKIGAAIAGAVGSVVSAIVPIIFALLAVLLPLIIALTILTNIIIGIASFFNPTAQELGSGALTGIEATIAMQLRSQGFSDASVAAVIANGIAESGLNPADDSNMDGQFHYAYERALGIWQYTHAGSSAPSENCHCEYCQFKSWCSQNNKDPYSVESQLWWTFDPSSEHNWQARWYPARHRSGYYLGDCGVPVDIRCDMTPEEFKAETDLEVATYSWMACYEGPSDVHSNFATGLDGEGRMGYARRIFAALGSLRTLSARQEAVIAATQSVPSPGSGLCATWVTSVFETADIGIFGGNANDQYRKWCNIDDLSQIKPGMIIAVDSHPHTEAGMQYGHVGIYIGEGQIRDNVGHIRTISLNDWVSYYSTKEHPARCGWIGGIELSPAGNSALVDAAAQSLGFSYSSPGVYSDFSAPTDCSGLVCRAVLIAYGIDIPSQYGVRTADQFYRSNICLSISQSDAQAGDLAFWDHNGDGHIDHIAIVTEPGFIIEENYGGCAYAANWGNIVAYKRLAL